MSLRFVQSIRVFDKDENDEWKLTSQWQAHKSVIWRVREQPWRQGDVFALHARNVHTLQSPLSGSASQPPLPVAAQ